MTGPNGVIGSRSLGSSCITAKSLLCLWHLKMCDLAAFGSATILAIVTPLIGWESLVRLGNPVPISFDKATLVAVLGQIVNLVAAWLHVLASGEFAQ